MGALVLLASCSTGTRAARDSGQSTLPPPSSTSQNLDLPFDWINVEYSRVSFEVGRAEALLAAACMRRDGFPVDTSGLFRVEPGRYTIDRRYATYNPSVARARGYMPEENDPNDVRQLPVPDDPAQRSAFLLALTGTADGLPHEFLRLVDPTGAQVGSVAAPHGCQEEAVKTLYGGIQQFTTYRQDDLFIQTVATKAQTMAAADPSVLDVRVAWSSCMRNRGYRYETPSDPQYATWPDPRPGREEVDTAVADMACRQQVGYLTVIADAERQAQLSLLNANGTTLNEILARRRSVVANAEAIAAANS